MSTQLDNILKDMDENQLENTVYFGQSNVTDKKHQANTESNSTKKMASETSRQPLTPKKAAGRVTRSAKAKAKKPQKAQGNSHSRPKDKKTFAISTDTDNGKGSFTQSKNKNQKKAKPLVITETVIPPILRMPLEVITKIGHFLPEFQDAVLLSSTCKDLQSMLGPKNRFFWFHWGTKSAPQKAFKTFNPDYDYRKSLVNMHAGRLTTRHCQVCLTTKGVKYHAGLDIKTCQDCFICNVACKLNTSISYPYITLTLSDLETVMFIPNIDWSTVKQHKVTFYDYTNNNIQRLMMYFDKFNCHGYCDIHCLCFMHDDFCHASVGRTIVWEPRFRNKVEKANPGKSYDECLEEADYDAEARKRLLFMQYNVEVTNLLNMILELTKAGRESYVTIACNMTQSEKENFMVMSKEKILNAVKDDYKFYLAYKGSFDQMEMPALKSNDWLKSEARRIAKIFFTRGGVWYFGN